MTGQSIVAFTEQCEGEFLRAAPRDLTQSDEANGVEQEERSRRTFGASIVHDVTGNDQTAQKEGYIDWTN
jgi:hypothetical protein